MNFYFLSTGRCGTRFFSQVLDTASNAVVFHQPKPRMVKEGFNVISKYVKDKELFKSLDVSNYSALEKKLHIRSKYSNKEVYGETLSHMFPFGYMLYKQLDSKVRLVHLIRDPVTCGRSILKAERGGKLKILRSPNFIKGKTITRKIANLWNNINGMVKYQFELINRPDICKVFRLEDISLETIQELFEFLELKGFSEKRISELMNDTSTEVRHSHIKRNIKQPDATKEELKLIFKLCSPLAKEYGYEDSSDS